MTENLELLHRYAEEQSEAAFAEFTQWHVDLVYSAALRLVGGNGASAEDVTQQVFTEVARQAKRLARHPALVGWLYTTTRLMALRMNRTEQRRKAREQEANTMNQLLHDDAPSSDWKQLRPVIEDAMHELNDKDRHAVLLRFFENQSLNQVGATLNLTENAARMRVDRAVEKLRGILARRGITTTTAALAAAVSANAVHAAPAGFAASLSAAALAASAVQASTLITATQSIAMTTLQKTVVVAALAAAIGTGIYALHRDSQLKAQVQTLQRAQAPLSAEQSASLIQIIKAEPAELPRGILGGPDKAFLRSQADIDNFLQQVAQSNQRILQQAASRLNPDQLAALDTVLTKAIEARKLQGAAFFQKH